MQQFSSSTSSGIMILHLCGYQALVILTLVKISVSRNPEISEDHHDQMVILNLVTGLATSTKVEEDKLIIRQLGNEVKTCVSQAGLAAFIQGWRQVDNQVIRQPGYLCLPRRPGSRRSSSCLSSARELLLRLRRGDELNLGWRFQSDNNIWIAETLLLACTLTTWPTQ